MQPGATRNPALAADSSRGRRGRSLPRTAPSPPQNRPFDLPNRDWSRRGPIWRCERVALNGLSGALSFFSQKGRCAGRGGATSTSEGAGMGLARRFRLVNDAVVLQERADDVRRCPILQEEAVSSQESRCARAVETTLTSDAAEIRLDWRFRLRCDGTVLWEGSRRIPALPEPYTTAIHLAVQSRIGASL